MKRLTRRLKNGRADCAYCTDDFEENGNCKNSCSLRKKQLEKLAAYEDIGLDPKRVHNLREKYKALKEKLATYFKAEQEGRLVVLPCKVGTRVWIISQNCDLCHDMHTEEPCLFGDCEYRGVIESVFTLSMTDIFGKTVFLTREEAEAALRKE